MGSSKNYPGKGHHMKFETIDQLYHFSALDKKGDEVKIAYVARSLEKAFTTAAERNYTFVKSLSVAHLEGVQRPSIAVHEALVDPIVGPSWLPFLWIINRVNRPSWSKPIVTAKFNENYVDINRISCPELRINSLPDGRCYLRIGSAAHIDRVDPGNAEVLRHLGWLPPRSVVERGYWRILPAGWNTIHAAHLAIQALSLTTKIRPEDWFRFDGAAAHVHSGVQFFDTEVLGHDAFYRVPEDGEKHTRLLRAIKNGYVTTGAKFFAKVVPRV